MHDENTENKLENNYTRSIDTLQVQTTLVNGYTRMNGGSYRIIHEYWIIDDRLFAPFIIIIR